MRFLCLSLVLLLCACTRSESLKSRQEDEEKLFVAQQKKISQAVKTPGEVNLHGVVFVLAEADSVYREVLRLALNDKTIEHTFFYKVQRVLGREDGVKISRHTSFGCEQVEVQFNPTKENWQKITVLEKCLRQPQQSFILTKNEKSIGVFKLEWLFETKAFTKIVGIGASLIRSQFRCEMDVHQFKLAKLECWQMAQQKNNSSYILTAEKLTATRVNEKFEISLIGQLSDNLEPLRKVELRVPLDGVIKILETELFPKEDLEESAPVMVPAKVEAPTSKPAASLPPVLMPGGPKGAAVGTKGSSVTSGRKSEDMETEDGSGTEPSVNSEDGVEIENEPGDDTNTGEQEDESLESAVQPPEVIPPPEAPRSSPNER